jgi:hypothetical protein
MADDIQTERFGESLTKESSSSTVLEALPVGTDSPYAPAGNSHQSEKKGCGCWGCGCAGMLIGSLLLMAGLGFGGYWFRAKQVEKYTDVEPADIPAVEMEEEELQRLQERIESFSKRIAPGKPDAELADDDAELAGEEEAELAEAPMELVLTADEINALIYSNESLRGMVHVVLEDGNVRGEVSVPLDEFPGGKGRYFNADAELEVSMENGVLVVKLVDATVKGEPLPEAFIQPMKEQNFAKQVYDDPETAKVLRRIESIEVIEDAIHIRLREDEGEGVAAEAPTDAEDPSQEVEPSAVPTAGAPLPFEP